MAAILFIVLAILVIAPVISAQNKEKGAHMDTHNSHSPLHREEELFELNAQEITWLYRALMIASMLALTAFICFVLIAG